jgi:ABC-type lipoprotein release transport system permease subunit
MILFRIALRNIFATKVRTLIIGALILFGTVLLVLGTSLLTTLEGTMARSIIGSVAGHLQVFDKDARDSVDLFSPPMGTPDMGIIKDFPKVKALLEGLQEVEAVVPMGNDFAMVFSGNIMDVKVAELRKSVEEGDEERVEVLKEHVRRIATLLEKNMDNLEGFADQDSTAGSEEEILADLARARSDEFWADFDDDREANISFLENKISWLAMDEKALFLRYIGTDTQQFSKNFELFEVVKGEMIPPGQRGFLFSDFMYEMQVKHTVAKRLDWIKTQLEGGRKLADDKALTNRVEQNVRQYKDILFQMDGPTARKVLAQVRELLGSKETDPVVLLQDFLKMSDENFLERYTFFYDAIAPHIVLYQVPIGENLVIRSFTRSGYATAVNIKVYGTYKFKGMEKSALSGAYNLMDIMSFRDLYGHLDAASREEIELIKAEAGAEVVDRSEAEDALFGDDDELVFEEDEDGFDEFAGVDMSKGGKRFTEEILKRVYTQGEIDSGVTTNAAIRLAPGVSVKRGLGAVKAAIESNGLNLKVIDWKQAAGLVGQFIGVVWIVLVTAILIIFLVALVIINNSMVMATMDRTQEIGTLRAIGAQRSYILKMFLIESSVLGLGFGILGLALGAAIVLTLGHVGIPAVSDELYFIFAGSRLYPELTAYHLAGAFCAVFVVSVLSTLYPARLATRVEPAKAMGKED